MRQSSDRVAHKVRYMTHPVSTEQTAREDRDYRAYLTTEELQRSDAASRWRTSTPDKSRRS
jgi:hypothetical protein